MQHQIQHTRWEILQTLKRQGSGTVEALCQRLCLAPMTVRQHLAILERDGLIKSTERRRGPGRPPHVFSLAPLAEDLFPKGYDRLAERLLQEFARLDNDDYVGLSPQQRLELIFQRIAERQASEMEAELHGADLGGRVARVSQMLRDREGTMSEWSQTDTGFEIDDYNCPFRNVALQEAALCGWHVQLLTYTLQAPVQMHACIAEGDTCCKFRVEHEPATSPSPAEVGGRAPETPS